MQKGISIDRRNAKWIPFNRSLLVFLTAVFWFFLSVSAVAAQNGFSPHTEPKPTVPSHPINRPSECEQART